MVVTISLLILLITGCTIAGKKIIELEKKNGQYHKISVNTPYDPCKIKGKRKRLIKCDWKLENGFRIVKENNEVTHVLEDPKRIYHKSTYDPNSI